MGTILKILCFLVLLIAATSVNVLAEAESAKPGKSSSGKTVAAPSEENSGSGEHSKEKRSREEIFSGNQQDQPNGLVDDLMSTSEEEDSSRQDDSSSSKEDNDDKRSGSPDNEPSEGWYEEMPVALPVSSSAAQYLNSAPPRLQTLASQGFSNGLYDQEDLYRRKRRQLAPGALPLRRRRSLRNSLGEMIQGRGLRMPRRSMRLKRQAGSFYPVFSDAFYDDQAQVPAQSHWESRMMKRHVPGHFGSRPDTADIQFPYSFKHRFGDASSDLDDYKDDVQQEPSLDEIDAIMLLPPNARYIDDPDMPNVPYLPSRSREEAKEAFQKWLSRYAVPSTVEVSRRSAPFYPLDYRYVAPFKKRNVFHHGNRAPLVDADEWEPERGAWGRVVQVPEAYASPEDVARLYGLASLMAEGDDEAKRSI